MTEKPTASITTGTFVVYPYFLKEQKNPNPTNEATVKTTKTTVKMRRTCRPGNIQIQDLKPYKAQADHKGLLTMWLLANE